MLQCNNVDNLKGQFMSLRFVFSAYGFLYKILSNSVNHKADRQLATSHSKLYRPNQNIKLLITI